MKKLFLLLLLLPSPVFAQSAMQTLANSMTAGTWAELNTNGRTITAGNGADMVNGYTLAFPNSQAAAGNIVYSTKLAYDQTHAKIYFYGQIHENAFIGNYCDTGSPNYNNTLCADYSSYAMVYNVTTNTWNFLFDSVTGKHHDGVGAGLSHEYGKIALDSATGDVYFHEQTAGNALYKFSFSSQSWAQNPVSCAAQVPQGSAFSIEWFPDYNGLIIPINNGGSIAFYDKTAGTCTTIFSGLVNSYLPVAVYNPFRHEMVVMSGSVYAEGGTEPNGRTFYIIKKNGSVWSFLKPDGTYTTTPSVGARTLTYINTCSSGFALEFDSEFGRGMIVPDPVTGKYIIMGRDASCAKKMYEYDPVADTLTGLSVSIPSSLVFANVNSSASGSIACVPVSDVGVIACWNEEPSNQGSTVWLYKHSGSAGGGDVTAPTTPTGLTNTGKTGTTAEVMWTASTDAVGVAGYKIKRDGTQIGQSTYPIFNDTGLSNNTSYTYTIAAFDAAGNTSSYSSGLAVTTNAQDYTFAQKCAQAGVIRCIDFDQQSQLRYHWPYAPVTGGSDAFARDWCQTALSGTYTNYPYSVWYSTYANTRATVQNGQCVYPVIDTSVKHDGTGSIKLPIPSHSDQDSSGEFREVFKKVGGVTNGDGVFTYAGTPTGSSPDATATHAGDDLYIQWYQRFDSTFITTPMNGYYTNPNGFGSSGFVWTTSGAGSTTVITPLCNIPAAVAGKHAFVEFGTNFTVGQYTVSTVAGNGCSMTFTTSPTPSGAGSAGWILVEGTAGTNRADGAKQMGIFPNPDPTGNFAYGTECCFGAFQGSVEFNQSLAPTTYGYAYSIGTVFYPHDGLTNYPQYLRNCTFTTRQYDTTLYTQPPCLKYQPNQWHEFTIHVKCNSSGSFNSILEQWLDGQKYNSITDFQCQYGNGASDNTGNGFGQFDITPYNTQKDPNQSYTDTAVWYDSIVISTQPILMGSSSGGVDSIAPIVSFTAPLNNSTQRNKIRLRVNAVDNVGVAGVQFKLDGVPIGVEDHASPYALDYSLTGVSFGVHTFAATARDAAGNISTASINVTVAAPKLFFFK